MSTNSLRAFSLPLLVLLAQPVGAADAVGMKRIAMFDGKSLQGWTTMDGKPVTRGWEVTKDGLLHLDRAQGRGGHILWEHEVDGDFELYFDWRVAKGGNSGLKYRVRRYGNQSLGCEFQLLDDPNHGNGRNPLTSAGALYGLFAPQTDKKKLAPIGEFNTSRVVVKGSHLQHWLNGVVVVDVVIGSERWQAQIRRSKFNDKPGFGENSRGKIMLQDHGQDVWFRKIDLLTVETP